MSTSFSADEITEDDEWTEGDITIITSNNVRFLIPSYYLLCHRCVSTHCQRETHTSAVLRDLNDLNPSGEKSITFADPEIETAPILRLFLQLVKTSELNQANRDELHRLALSIRKWECTATRNLLLCHLQVPHCTTTLPKTSTL